MSIGRHGPDPFVWSYDPGPPYRLVVAMSPAGPVHQEAMALLERLFPAALARGLGPSRAAVVVRARESARETEDLLRSEARSIRCVFAVDAPLVSREEVTASYERVVALRDLIVWNLCAGRAVLRPQHVAAVELLKSIPFESRRRFVATVLGPVLRLPQHRAIKLVEVLDGLAAGLQGRRLAEALNVHHKTVTYRKRMLHHHTRLDPTSPHERLLLLVALFLWRIDGVPQPVTGLPPYRES